MVRVTFALDEATVAEIRRTAARLKKPQSHVVREAVAEYAAQAECLSASERARALGVIDRLDELDDRRAPRSARQVDAELRDLRSARRSGGRGRARAS